MGAKTQQLQIRVTPRQKALLKRLARQAGQDVSAYVLSRALPEERVRFVETIQALRRAEEQRFNLAELNDLLSSQTRAQLADAVAYAPRELKELSPLLQNYVAAMVEMAVHRADVPAPAWVHDVTPLEEPYFAAPLKSLQLHLLRAAAVPFRRRNIFVDASIGARV